MEEAGRATEMGKPTLFVPGISDFNEVQTIAGVNVLGHVAKLTAEYETELNVPVSKSIVMEAAREICKDSYLQVGRPDLYHNDMVHYIAESQFVYAAGINGIMLREKPSACFYQGQFYAESLLLAETGNSIELFRLQVLALHPKYLFHYSLRLYINWRRVFNCKCNCRTNQIFLKY